jgi:hypothetical protein
MAGLVPAIPFLFFVLYDGVLARHTPGIDEAI